MRILVIGQGGREHALARALSRDVRKTDLFVTPGLSGFVEATQLQIPVDDIDRLKALALGRQFDTVVVGPEVPLAMGLADSLRSIGLHVVGPGRAAAQLESSKIYAKELMVEAGVPTAAYRVVSSVAETMQVARHEFDPPYVLKADGLAAGKGVFITHTWQELEAVARLLFEDRVLGASGERAVFEQFQSGWELSYLCLVAGENFQVLPLMQDHKRLLDGDRGPNTGGMGVVGPIAMDDSLRAVINEGIVRPTLSALRRRGLDYRGVLYFGLMMTPEGPRVIEYNIRFGDPEAQLILPLLVGSWAQVFHDLARGHLTPLEWSNQFGCCVVLAAEGYPQAPVKGALIQGDLGPADEQSYFLHAGTALGPSGAFVVAGGRVLNAVGLGESLPAAVRRAYRQAERARWPGRQLRSDIGKQFLTTDLRPGR
jgi:phosphoribosylamine--glycine ligase